ncbi:MAG: ABC transporter permease [Burkholderiaceae bacterium]
MIAMLRLALASLWNRRVTALLTVLCMALSVALLIGVEKLRRDGRAAFANTISGTDLVVGAPTGDVQLLLQTVFRIGSASGNLSWEAYERWRDDPRIAWSVPISLGDSHRGFPVLGTSRGYFEHYRHGARQALRFASGRAFEAPLEAVIGAEVARRLAYQLGQEIHLAHGAGEIAGTEHAEHELRVVGILAPTGTPVDATVHVDLAAIEQIHEGWEQGHAPNALDRLLAGKHAHERESTHHDEPQAITAFLVGLSNRSQLFAVQRAINTDPTQPMQAVIPGMALQQLWDVFAVAENLLRIVSWLVIGTGIASMLIVLLSSMQARRREMAVLRAVGATPWHLAGLLLAEAAMITVAGMLVGLGLLFTGLALLRPLVAVRYGLDLPLSGLTPGDVALLALVLGAALAASLIPVLSALRQSLADGLSVRL